MGATKYTLIEVPDLNDSVSRIVLDDTVYYIRFTYNDTFDFWKLSVYTDLMEPIVQGIKIVPNYPLNLFVTTRPLPRGFFMAYSRDDRICRSNFRDGKAEFMFVPVQ